MLVNYPIKLNNVTLLFPTSWDERYSQVESVNVSEAGTDIVQVTRLLKLTLSLGYNVTGTLLPTFEYFRNRPDETITVSVFDADADNYVTKTMRMRNFKKSLKRKSQELGDVNGIWSVSFDLIEM